MRLLLMLLMLLPLGMFDKLRRRFPDRRTPPAGATTEWSQVHPGATRNWHPFVRAVVRFIEWKYGVICTTYRWHGENDDGAPNGERFSFDAWFGRDNICADADNTRYGVDILRLIEHRPGRFL